jgi:IclR family transcriptional regulator, blcABC operon repressor
VRVPAVERSVRVLRTLSEAGRSVGFAEIAARTGLPRSSLHDLLDSLRATGLVERGRSGSYTLGLLLVELAGSRLAGSDLVSEFVHACDRDELLVGRTLVLGILEGNDVMYVATRSGDANLAVNYHVGKRLPANCTATGKAVLGTLPPDRLADLVPSDLPLRALTTRSITDPAVLRDDLRVSADRGYAIDDEETAIGMICVGAPVYGRAGIGAVGAVATSIVKAGFGEAERARVVHGVVALAHDISARLGARPGHLVSAPASTRDPSRT